MQSRPVFLLYSNRGNFVLLLLLLLAESGAGPNDLSYVYLLREK